MFHVISYRSYLSLKQEIKTVNLKIDSLMRRQISANRNNFGKKPQRTPMALNLLIFLID